MTGSGDTVNVKVVVDDEHLQRLDEVQDGLQAAGLNIESCLSVLGIVIGTVAGNQILALEEIDGVQMVEKEKSVNL